MRTFLFVLLFLSVRGYRLVDVKLQTGKFMKNVAAGVVIAALIAPANTNAVMETSNPIPESMRYITERNVKPLPYYFGVGCFWHVQHEFVNAEMRELGRTAKDVSSLAGYAAGSKKNIMTAREKLSMVAAGTSYQETDDIADRQEVKAAVGNLVCYHNALNRADYGKLGYTEVVGINLPSNKVEAFATDYFKLFGADSERPDKGDVGSEYRSVIGIPGGMSGETFNAVKTALLKSGKDLKLVEGNGNEKDTLGKKIVYVMDSNLFPFKQAEVYHQFHDGFMAGEDYDDTYYGIKAQALADGRIGKTGCPNRDGTPENVKFEPPRAVKKFVYKS